MSDKIRVGIVGATTRKAGSGWGANAHVPALQALSEDYELAAVCTAHEESARDAAAAWGARHAFHDARALVAAPDVDLMVVVVRVPRHREIVTLAAEAGKAVLCEWPLAANLGEAEELAALVAKHEVTGAVGLQARSDPAIVRARELVADGAIGTVLAVNLKVLAPNDVVRPAPRMWQGQRAAGANPLTIAGGHAIDALRHVFGEVSEVAGRTATRTPQWTDADSGASTAVDAPDVASMVGALAGGAEVSAQVVGLPGAIPFYQLQAFGTGGMIELVGPFVSAGPSQLMLGSGGKPEPVELPALPAGVPPGGPARNVAASYLRLAAALRGGEPFAPSFDDALSLHRLLETIETGSRS